MPDNLAEQRKPDDGSRICCRRAKSVWWIQYTTRAYRSQAIGLGRIVFQSAYLKMDIDAELYSLRLFKCFTQYGKKTSIAPGDDNWNRFNAVF